MLTREHRKKQLVETLCLSVEVAMKKSLYGGGNLHGLPLYECLGPCSLFCIAALLYVMALSLAPSPPQSCVCSSFQLCAAKGNWEYFPRRALAPSD